MVEDPIYRLNNLETKMDLLLKKLDVSPEKRPFSERLPYGIKSKTMFTGSVLRRLLYATSYEGSTIDYATIVMPSFYVPDQVIERACKLAAITKEEALTRIKRRLNNWYKRDLIQPIIIPLLTEGNQAVMQYFYGLMASSYVSTEWKRDLVPGEKGDIFVLDDKGNYVYDSNGYKVLKDKSLLRYYDINVPSYWASYTTSVNAVLQMVMFPESDIVPEFICVNDGPVYQPADDSVFDTSTVQFTGLHEFSFRTSGKVTDDGLIPFMLDVRHDYYSGNNIPYEEVVLGFGAPLITHPDYSDVVFY